LGRPPELTNEQAALKSDIGESDLADVFIRVVLAQRSIGEARVFGLRCYCAETFPLASTRRITSVVPRIAVARHEPLGPLVMPRTLL
jgi:hypothetical protein